MYILRNELTWNYPLNPVSALKLRRQHKLQTLGRNKGDRNLLIMQLCMILFIYSERSYMCRWSYEVIVLLSEYGVRVAMHVLGFRERPISSQLNSRTLHSENAIFFAFLSATGLSPNRFLHLNYSLGIDKFST